MGLWSRHPMLCLGTTVWISELYNLNLYSTTNLHKKSSRTPTRESTRLREIKLAYYSFILFLVFRVFMFCFTAESSAEHQNKWEFFYSSEHLLPFHLNPMLMVMVDRFPHALTASILSSLVLMGLWVVYFDYMLTFRFDGVLLKATYAVMIANGRHFRELNGRRLGWPQNSLNRNLEKLARLPFDYLLLARRIWTMSSVTNSVATFPPSSSSPRLQFSPPSSSFSSPSSSQYLGFYSASLRGRLYVYSAAYEALVVFLSLFIMFIATLFLIAATVMVYSDYYHTGSADHFTPTTEHPVTAALFAYILLDYLLVCYAIWSSMRTAIFAVHIILVWSFVAGGHLLGTLNRQLLMALALQQQQQRLSSSSSLSSKSTELLLQQLRRFYREHASLLAFFRHLNGRLISRLFFTALIANVAVNLVLIGNLLFRRSLPPEPAILMVLIIFAQTLIFLVAASGLIALSGSFYRSDRLLYRAQLALLAVSTDRKRLSQDTTGNGNEGGKQTQQQQQQWLHYRQSATLLLAKLHLSTFYETVCTRDQFRFTFGPHTKISYRSMFEFLFVYSGFVMYVAKMIRNGRL